MLNQDYSSFTQNRNSTFGPSNTKIQITPSVKKKKRNEIAVYSKKTKKEKIPRSLVKLLVSIAIYFILGCLFSLGRYIIISNKNKQNAYLCEGAQVDVEWYNNMQCVHSSLMELFLTDNTITFEYQSTLEFYRARRKIVDKRVIGRMEKLYNTDVGNPTTSYRDWIDTNMRVAYKKTDENAQYYVNDTIAMAGIVDNGILTFAKKYVILLDQLVQEWELSKTKEEKSALLKKEQYSSILAFATYNNLGTVDAVYYHVVYPLWTLLTIQLGKMPAFISLMNILSYSYAILLFIIGLVLIISPFNKIHKERDSIMYCIPLRLIDENYHWKNILKHARETSKFTYI